MPVKWKGLQTAAFVQKLRQMRQVCEDRGLQKAADLLAWFIDGDSTRPLDYDAELHEAWTQVVLGEDVRHLPSCPAFRGGPCGGKCEPQEQPAREGEG